MSILNSLRVPAICMLLIAATTSLQSPAKAGIDRELLDNAIQTNRASTQGIATLLVELRLTMSIGSNAPHYGESAVYWRDHGVTRIRQTTDRGDVYNFRMDESRIWSLADVPTADRSTRRMGMVIDEVNNFSILSDAWKQALFDLPRLEHTSGSPVRNPMKQYAIWEALEKLKVLSCSRVRRNGHRLVQIEVHEGIAESNTNWEYRIWLDPAVNGLAREIEFTVTGDNFRRKCKFIVDSFAEPKPSVFFPESVRSSFTLNDNQPIERVTRFSRIVVNEHPKLPFSTDLEIPGVKGGLLVTDRIEGTIYRVDPKGRRVGQASVLREAPALIPPPADSAIRTSRPWREYLLGAGVVLGILSMVSYHTKLRRARATRKV